MDKKYRQGIIYILICQTIWGFMPIYWQSLEPIESWKIILYRMLTMFAFTYLAARIKYDKEEIWGPLRDGKIRLRYFTSGIVLASNWSIYIWAMNSGRVVQASIGYFIEPIVICAFGVIIFKEQLTKYNLTSMVLALTAIAIMLIHYRQLPLVALGLALTWAVYSAIKKASDMPPLITLTYETLPLAIAAAISITYIEMTGKGALVMHLPRQYAMMLLSGPLTFVPVALFGYAAQRVPLLFMGLVQYLSPTISLILGIFMFKEPTDRVQIFSLIIIWIGLAVFTFGEFKNARENGGEISKEH